MNTWEGPEGRREGVNSCNYILIKNRNKVAKSTKGDAKI